MKKATSLLLVLTMVLSLLSGCGKPAAQESAPQVPETAPSAETAAPTTEPTTEPTLSPEELLYNSLTDRQRQAVDVGIVELSQMEDLERIVTIGEASAMLQKAYIHRTGVESKMLKELMSREEYASRNASRGWLMGMPGLADLELTHGEKYENYGQWFRLTGDNGGWATLWSAFDKRFGAKGIIPMDFSRNNGERYNAESDTVFADVFCSLPVAALDCAEYVVNTGPGMDPVYHGLPETIAYAFKIFDDTNGKKFMELEDGYIHPYREITLGEMAEHALVYYNFPNPMAYPEYVAPEEVGTYNTTIIPAELLAKDTDLPGASCQHLPAQWHGVVMDDMELLTSDIHLDDNVYEYEIKAVKDAGFNYICLNLDFNWLQDYQLFNIENNASTAFRAITQMKDAGKLSVERLEKLDQVLAWCMEYDIHLNLRATGTGGYYNSARQNIASATNDKLNISLAQLWQAVARRYADIPNEYLSFTLFSHSDMKVTNNLLLPSVDAIREVSPDRCILAEISGWGTLTAEPFADKGVALSFKLEEPSAVLNHNDYFGQIAMNVNGLKNTSAIDSFTWPYQGNDAEMLLATKRSNTAQSCAEVMAVAEQYGVGFLLGEFGVELRNQENTLLPRTRYADDAYQAMIVDITSTVAERGYGWCFGNWYGYFGIAAPMPIIKNTTYEQIEDYPYYIDQTMLGWFQEINGVQ